MDHYIIIAAKFKGVVHGTIMDDDKEDHSNVNTFHLPLIYAMVGVGAAIFVLIFMAISTILVSIRYCKSMLITYYSCMHVHYIYIHNGSHEGDFRIRKSPWSKRIRGRTTKEGICLKINMNAELR